MKKNVKLNQVIEYENKKRQEKAVYERPSFHLTPPTGWMNDPNGFSFFKGEYHLFYQYHPYNTNWGPMHWGHSKTMDFVKWEQLPCALAPDMKYDGQGCFSGSAMEDGGTHILMYTSVLEEEQEDGSKKVRQTQSIAVGDGITYEKLSRNPVITSSLLPKGSSKKDFRDPKIWKDGDTFYAAVGSEALDGYGQITLFSSQNLEDWKFESIMDSCKGEYGKMWECPDFFTLDGKQILIISPQFMRAKDLEFHNGNNSVYFIGSFDRERKIFVREKGFSLDYGMDFYAPQTVESADGRRIMVAWLQSWDNYMTPEQSNWSGMMTIPRELSIQGKRLIQVPVRELENYRVNKIAEDIVFSKKGEEPYTFEKLNNRSFDMTIEADVNENSFFTISVAANEEYDTKIVYDGRRNVLTTDRTNSGLRKDLICSRTMRVGKRNGRIKLRILMDKYTIEIFVNDGEQAMTSLIYTPLEAGKIVFESMEAIIFHVEKYDLRME